MHDFFFFFFSLLRCLCFWIEGGQNRRGLSAATAGHQRQFQRAFSPGCIRASLKTTLKPPPAVQSVISGTFDLPAKESTFGISHSRSHLVRVTSRAASPLSWSERCPNRAQPNSNAMPEWMNGWRQQRIANTCRNII